MASKQFEVISASGAYLGTVNARSEDDAYDEASILCAETGADREPGWSEFELNEV